MPIIHSVSPRVLDRTTSNPVSPTVSIFVKSTCAAATYTLSQLITQIIFKRRIPKKNEHNNTRITTHSCHKRSNISHKHMPAHRTHYLQIHRPNEREPFLRRLTPRRSWARAQKQNHHWSSAAHLYTHANAMVFVFCFAVRWLRLAIFFFFVFFFRFFIALRAVAVVCVRFP